MIRVLTIFAVVAAGQKKAKAPRRDVNGFFLDIGTAERLDLKRSVMVWNNGDGADV